MKWAKLVPVLWLGLLSEVQASQDNTATLTPTDSEILTEISGGPSEQPCPNENGWKPGDERLKEILSEHSRWIAAWASEGHGTLQWATQNPDRRANLCRANLSGAMLDNADLTGAKLTNANLNEADLNNAKLNGADLDGAELNGAKLLYAKLNKAHLLQAKLNKAILTGADLDGANLIQAQLRGALLADAQLNRADLSSAKLEGAYLPDAALNEANLLEAELNDVNMSRAELNKAHLTAAKLRGANLSYAKLDGASLKDANLDGAHMVEAQLIGADLTRAKLNGTDLTAAKLRGADLSEAEVKDATFAGVDLDQAIYAPASPPPSGYLVNIRGLRTVTFPDGGEVGLVQLRELLQKAGLRDLEREATYAIERGKTAHEFRAATPPALIDATFRKVAFEWPVAYGQDPGRALALIVALWAVLVPVYWWAIWRRPWYGPPTRGIFRVWPRDCMEVRDGKLTLDTSARIELINERGLKSLLWSAYFSLLSAFYIGFREFNVGTWIARLQSRSYTLQPEGWARTVSGAQSLLSVYLLAIWALSYFGRPFQ